MNPNLNVESFNVLILTLNSSILIAMLHIPGKCIPSTPFPTYPLCMYHNPSIQLSAMMSSCTRSIVLIWSNIALMSQVHGHVRPVTPENAQNRRGWACAALYRALHAGCFDSWQKCCFPKNFYFHFRQEVVNYFLHQMLRMPEAKMSNEEHAEIGQEKVWFAK